MQTQVPRLQTWDSALSRAASAAGLGEAARPQAVTPRLRREQLSLQFAASGRARQSARKGRPYLETVRGGSVLWGGEESPLVIAERCLIFHYSPLTVELSLCSFL